MNLVNLKIKQDMYILHFNENTTISTYGEMDVYTDWWVDGYVGSWIDR